MVVLGWNRAKHQDSTDMPADRIAEEWPTAFFVEEDDGFNDHRGWYWFFSETLISVSKQGEALKSRKKNSCLHSRRYLNCGKQGSLRRLNKESVACSIFKHHPPTHLDRVIENSLRGDWVRGWDKRGSCKRKPGDWAKPFGRAGARACNWGSACFRPITFQPKTRP